MNYLPYLLPLSIATPLLIVLLMMILGGVSERVTLALATVGFLLPAIFAFVLVLGYADNTLALGGYAYIGALSVGLDAWGIALSFGLNGIALVLFTLAAWVGLAAGLYAIQGPAEEKPAYLMLLLIMYAGLLGTFASTNLFFFFFFHELALIPTFIMIGRWGGQGRRVAAMEITVYLTVGAMLTLAGLIGLYIHAQPFIPTFDMRALAELFSLFPPELDFQWVVGGLLMIGLGILVSIFPFHSWAPRGYAAAPASVAMLHAGVLKKFGLYGFIQVVLPLLPLGMEALSPYLVPLALCNVLYIGFVTISQRDLKLMLGYGSVMHMGYAFLGIATLSILGIGGAVVLMLGHGLTVALLFLLSTSIYRRTGTYDMQAMGGLCAQSPVLAAFFIAASLASLGLPGFLNFWGELGIFIALWDYHPLVAALAILGVIISAIYGLRSVARIFFGPAAKIFPSASEDFPWSERWPALLLLLALLGLGIWPRPLIDIVDASLKIHTPVPIFWVSPESDIAITQ